MNTFGLTQGQYYFYSAFAQVAGALVGFVVLAFIFGQQRESDPASDTAVHSLASKHTNRMVVGAGLLLIDVMVAAGIVLFGDGGEIAVYSSRVILALGAIPLTGSLTYHQLWRSEASLRKEANRSRQIRGRWVTGLVGVIALITVRGVLPFVFNAHKLGVEDLALVTAPLLGATLLGGLAFGHFMKK